MSGMAIMVQTLLAGNLAGVDDRVYSGRPEQAAAHPYIAVHLIFQSEELLLAGESEWPVARVRIEFVAGTMADADRLAEAGIAWLRNKHNYEIAGFIVEIKKEGTDETEGSRVQSVTGHDDASRRIVDYYARFRQAPA